MPVYIQARHSDTWHWCRNCSRYPATPVQSGARIRTDRPPGALCTECRRKERKANCD
jgi:hypothetical protein